MTVDKARLSKLRRTLSESVVVVTGAASGVGRATACLLADEGAAVGLVDRDAERLEAVWHELTHVGVRAHAVVVDLEEAGAPSRAVLEIRNQLGPIDAVVNNAGFAAVAGITDERFDSVWSASLTVNLSAYAEFVRATVDDLARNGNGRIVNIASSEGLGATAGLLPYTVAKHGVVGLTRSLAVELGPVGVTVNCVCPGPIETAMTAAVSIDAKRAFARRRTALRRYGDPEEVAHIIVSLLMPSASYITGAVIPVDGGLMVRNA
ncbi:3-oxoacyl-[acyl-carrier protein] reductase [Mycobacterium sp. MAA66]|uniref:SDR family NAD(P)-dependent oxidoreductase n=1 Tax=Mycobacterium sp. MAA66 TaxID=3156297 RepID=UPI0035181F82